VKVKDMWQKLVNDAKATPPKTWGLYAVVAVIFGLISFSAFSMVASRYQIGWGMSECLPETFFWIDKTQHTGFKRGDYVAFKTRGLEPFYPKGLRFMKIITGVPGDTVVKQGNTISVCKKDAPANCSVFKVNRISLSGLPIPEYYHWQNEQIVPESCYFVSTPHPRSFDSRYWGYVCDSEIIGKGKPLL